MAQEQDCLFCRIGSGELPVDKVYEDDEIVGFRDIRPQAPEHMLLIPRRHIASLQDCTPEDADILGKLLGAVRDVAGTAGLTEKGYRVVVNVGPDGGQTVYHLHVHVLGGRALGWPPG